MSTITTIQSTDTISASRSTINTNFANLNTDKAEKSGGTFTGDISVPDEAYGVGWNGSLEVPTKNALYDKIETMGGGGSTTLDGLTDVTIASVTNGQALIYESASSQWKNQSLPGGGDMLKSTYDTDNDGVVDYASGTTSTVKNSTGATLTKGTTVYINGGNGGLPTIAKGQANTEGTSAGTFGMVFADIANNATGTVVKSGRIANVDTRTIASSPITTVTLVDGDTIYLDPTTAGYITNVKPVAPNHMVYIGKVITAGNNGILDINIRNGYELDEIHDVLITSKADSDVLVYENSTSLWKNKTQDNAGIVTKATAQTISGVKTFLTGMFGLRNVANTFTSFFSNTNTASRTYTLQDSSDTLVGRATTDTLTNKTLTTPAIASIKGTLTADTDGATITFDKNVSDFHSVTLGGNRTLALSNMATGDRIVLRLQQDATGSRVPTFFTTIKWAGGSAPTLTTTPSKADMFGFLCTSAGNYDGFILGQNI